jgi:glyoxylase-like metal-dependent hydrolase (beta-lactamase superfamily II)
MDNALFEVIHVRPRIYMLASESGNVTLQIGDAPGQSGLVLVDTGSTAMSTRTLSEIRKITTKPVLFIINTSADAHHIGANETIAAPAPAQGLTRAAGDAVSIFAQDNVLSRMSAPGSNVPALAWPSITLEEEKDFPSNGEPIQIIAEKSAHTDGDSIVFFRSSNVISTGDIFTTTGYPVIDLKRGGSIQGELKALNHILDLAVPEVMQEGGTMIIPGQGRLCDEADVVEYRDMVTIIRDRVADMLKHGKTLDQVKAAKLSLDYDGRFSTSVWTGDMFVEAIYNSLRQNKD